MKMAARTPSGTASAALKARSLVEIQGTWPATLTTALLRTLPS